MTPMLTPGLRVRRERGERLRVRHFTPLHVRAADQSRQQSSHAAARRGQTFIEMRHQHLTKLRAVNGLHKQVIDVRVSFALIVHFNVLVRGDDGRQRDGFVETHAGVANFVHQGETSG